jgi:hypothetical protein
MSLEKKYSFDLAVGLLVGFLVLLIWIVIWLGNQSGVRVTPQFLAGGGIGPFGPLTLVFSEPVDDLLVTDKIHIVPEVEGEFRWVDPKTLRFVPLEPLEPDIPYEFRLSAGPLTKEGALLKKAKTWAFRVRAPLVVYLVAEANQSRLWSVEPDTGKINPLTDEFFRIANFDTSRDGEFVVFSAFNEQSGMDLWRVDRSGENRELLLPCERDRCSVPAISPDGSQVAYVREGVGPSTDLQFGAPRIWLLKLETKVNAPLYEDQQIVGYGPVWSPDGTYLSSFDGLSDKIHLLNLVTNDQIIISSNKGNPVTWSGDSSTFVYTDIQATESGRRTQIRAADMIYNETTILLGDKDERDYYYNSLAWSPIENALVIGLRAEEENPAEALVLMDPNRLDGQVIADQADTIYHTPYWDPWGTTLVFQQFELYGDYKPQIALWEVGTEIKVIAEGLAPDWLP